MEDVATGRVPHNHGGARNGRGADAPYLSDQGERITVVKALLSLLIAGALLTAGGCQSTPRPTPNYGQTGGRMDPAHDAPSEAGSGLRSADLVSSTDQMAQSIASRLDITNADSPPVIFVGEIENKTMSTRNYQILLARLRSTLNESGARHGLRFVRERQYIEQQRNREFGEKDPDSSADSYRSRADYVLTCEVYDHPLGRTNYYLLDFQLVQLREAIGGPDIGPGAIVWEKGYEVKYQW